MLEYEAPPANGSVADTLGLIAARGFTVHPCDWIPDFRWQYSSRHPAIYQPWADYLSEHGYTKFHSGNTLTIENAKRFSPAQRCEAFRTYVRAFDIEKNAYGMALIKSQPAGVRAQLLNEVNAGGAFYGVRPWQVPFIEEFLDDKAASVRKVAEALLERQAARLRVEDYAQTIAQHLAVTSDTVTYRDPPEYLGGFLFKEFCCVTFGSLAMALGLSPRQLAQRADLDGLGSNFLTMVAISAGVEERTVLATRALDQGWGGEKLPLSWFEGVHEALWQRGLEAMKKSPYINSVQEYLGEQTGTISARELRAWEHWEYMRNSVTSELESGELPVNKAYDSLRYLGKLVDREAAQMIIDEALSLGMKPDNPRLTMLRLNVALRANSSEH